MKTLLTTIALLIISLFAQGQSDQDSTNIFPNRSRAEWLPVVAYRGVNQHFVEIGFSRAGVGHGIVGWEMTFANNLKASGENISMASMGYFSGFAFFEIGAHFSYITNYNIHVGSLKPYIGIGLGGFATAQYGYNALFGNSILKDELNRHELRICLRIPNN